MRSHRAEFSRAAGNVNLKGGGRGVLFRRRCNITAGAVCQVKLCPGTAGIARGLQRVHGHLTLSGEFRFCIILDCSLAGICSYSYGVK